MFELSPLLLALAFIAVGAAAWYLGQRGVAPRMRLPRDYYVGLDHLINDRFDRAVEVFARMAEQDGDAAEIQFALGSLFRRRGEVDRAIAIHTRLRAIATAPALRDKAAFALALDYLSAGLMDRAEQLLEELTASREHRAAALDHLVRIYESQGDWANALKVFHQLPAAVQSERRHISAHYLCELSEQALLQGEIERARTLLRQARTHTAELPRAGVLAARIAELEGDARGAMLLYLQALEAAPGVALEIIPRLEKLAHQVGDLDILGELAERLQRGAGLSPRQLLWLLATALPDGQLERLEPLARCTGADVGVLADAGALRGLLTRIGDAGGRYQCEECGLHSIGWYWRCPKCRTWDSLRPSVFRWAERAEDVAQRASA